MTFNALSGVIPLCADHFDFKDFSIVQKPIDHYSGIKGNGPCGKPGTSTRAYNPPVIPNVGSCYGVHKLTAPSYSEIGNTNTIHYPGDYETLITAEITPEMDVRLNGVLIAGAPEYRQMKNGKSKKCTQIERSRFCRDVIWFLMNDETCLKDKLQEIGYSVPVVPSVPIIADVTDHIIEHITGSDLPGPGALESAMSNKHFLDEETSAETADILTRDILDEAERDPVEITGDNPVQDQFELYDYWPGVFAECSRAMVPAVPKYPRAISRG